MKYSSLPSEGEEEDSDVQEPPVPFVAPVCHERWIFLLSMMGFLMIVVALSLHDNKTTQELRGYSMNQTEFEVEPCSLWQSNCPHDDSSGDAGDDLAALEAFMDEPSDLTYDEVVEQFSEHIDEGNTPLDEGEEEQQPHPQQDDEEDDDVQEVNEMHGLEPMEDLYDSSRNGNPPNASETDSALIAEEYHEIPEESTIARIEDEENFGN